MSIFSDKLKEYMKQKNEKVYSLSQMCDISRANMYKIVQGTRHPANVEMVYRIADALGLSPYEKRGLIESYQITMIGKDIYEERSYIVHLISSLKKHRNLPVEWGQSKENPETQGKKKFLYGKKNVNGEIRKIIKREAQKESGKICVIGQPDYAFIQQMLISYCENKNVEIQHIICMESRENGERNTYNLSNFTHISPFLISECKYKAYYYYDNVQSHFYNLNLLPCVIVTGDEVIQGTSDYEYAIYDCSRERVNVFHKMFQDFLKRTSKIFRISQNLEEAGRWISMHKIDAVLSCDYAGYLFMEKWKGKTAKNLKIFISEEETKDASFNKWKIEEEKRDSWRDSLLEKKGKSCKIHSELFPVPENFLMLTETGGNILLIFEKENQNWGVLEIYETSIKKSMYQFLENLDKSLLAEHL